MPNTAPAGFAAAHLFRPDAVDWGYRPLCLECGRERPAHVPALRKPARQQEPTEEQP